MTIEAGTRIGKYEIESLLGAGGMGEVYRAHDTEMNRPVALKFLPDDVASDARRMKHLLKEACDASRLNHPNILTVYEIGQTDGGARFFVAEFVNGVTLREHMRDGRPKLGDVLDFGVQVASALVAAHAGGLVHRDIKPENVMIRHDRLVKVIDFGLAKVEGSPGVPVNTEATTQALAGGGTIAYMSPEQARGGSVDARTDVWSLGVVLYEMLVGRRPFQGLSPSHILVSIQEDEPPPLAQHAADAPELMQEIIHDALAKDPDARLTARQALAKLERLKRRVQAAADLGHEPAQDAPSGDTPERTPVSPTASGDGTRDATTGPDSPGAAPQSGRRRAFAAALALAALAGIVALYLLMWPAATSASAPVINLSKLLTDRQVIAAVISPDGKYFACVTSKGGRQGLWLREVSEASEQGREFKPPADIDPAVDPAGITYSGVAFSPDGDYLYYIVGVKNAGYGVLYRKALKLEKEPQKIVSDANGTVAVSPNGRQVAFRRHLSKMHGVDSPPLGEESRGKQQPRLVTEYDEDQLLIWDEDRGGERVLVTRRDPDSIGSLAWSPDGQMIAYASGSEDERGSYERIEAVNVADEESRTISSARWKGVGSVVWLSDGKGLVITGRLDAATPGELAQIRYVSYPGGEVLPLTNGTQNYASLSGNSKAMLAVLDNRLSEILILDGNASPRPLLESSAYVVSLAWAPKGGRIVYSEESGKEGGGYDIRTMNADGSDRQRLISTPDSDTEVAALPDGDIVYRSYHRKQSLHDVEKVSLYRWDAEERKRVLLSDKMSYASGIQVSPDSQWVYYTSPGSSGRPALWKVSAVNGRGETEVRGGVENSRISPDGTQFVALDAAANPRKPGEPRKMIVFPADGGEPLWERDAPPDITSGTQLEWTPNGRDINYVAPYEGVPNVWRLPLGGGKPQPLTNWTDGDISWFAWSRDGKLSVVRHTATTELDLIKIKDSR